MRRMLLVAIYSFMTVVCHAGIVTFATPISGFVPDSLTAAGSTGSAFLAAAGGSVLFSSFDTDRFGNPLPSTGDSLDGGIFLNQAVFSSAPGTYGGSNSPNVQYSGSGPDSEVGPDQSFTGTLVINFATRGFLATAVAFGAVQVGDDPGEVYRVYDQNGALVLTLPAPFPDTFQFVGFAGNSGTQISRVEIDANFFAIQDINFNAGSSTVVPEPATITLLGLALFALCTRARR